jgi:nucleotide-binding universal stress UspA family protein
MGKIIACIDGSAYADHVCHLSAWAHERTGLAISLLHVVAPHSEVVKADMTGQIGLGAKANLMEELTKLDEEHGKLELRKGQLMLEHAKEELAANGITQPEVLHRCGSLVETITELEAQAELIVMGKRGEHHQNAPDHLGSNLERVARAIHKPLLVATPNAKPVQKYLIAYDGSPSANKAVEFAANNPLLKGLECHLLKVGEASPEAKEMLMQAENTLKSAGVTVHSSFKQGKPVDAMVAEYVSAHAIDLLVIGAYGHSKIRSLILGSTTTALIRKSDVPVLLFR